MRMILYVTFPTEKFNAALREGTVQSKLGQILEDIKPEAVYFGGPPGAERGVVAIVDVASADQLPAVTEPWYLAFDAEVEAKVAMTAEDIGNLDLGELVKKYG